jgi:hypothetical protein
LFLGFFGSVPSLGPPAGQLQFIEYIKVCNLKLAERLIIPKDAVPDDIHALYTASKNEIHDGFFDNNLELRVYYYSLLDSLIVLVAVAIVNTCLASMIVRQGVTLNNYDVS